MEPIPLPLTASLVSNESEHPVSEKNNSDPNKAGDQSTDDESSEKIAQGSLSPRFRHRVFPTVRAFWKKMNNDWLFNLAGLLAYNFLMALFPVLLLVVAGFGIVLNHLLPASESTVERYISEAFPPRVGAIIVHGVTTHLTHSIGPLLLVGLVTALITGSRLFLTLENCFGIIFRLQGRTPLRQNRMAFGMLLLYLLLLPLLFLVSIVPSDLLYLFDPHEHSVASGAILTVSRLMIGFLAAFLLFGATYLFVPHRHGHWRHWRYNWPGALVASLLLLLYEGLFPLYERLFLHADDYGSVAGFAIVILLFFYYLAFILLLGAEVNSWVAGQRETAADLPGVLHAVQAHRSIQGAAGPTAGAPEEEMQHHPHRRLAGASRAWHAARQRLPRWRQHMPKSQQVQPPIKGQEHHDETLQ